MRSSGLISLDGSTPPHPTNEIHISQETQAGSFRAVGPFFYCLLIPSCKRCTYFHMSGIEICVVTTGLLWWFGQ